MTNLDAILQQLKRGLEDLYGPRLRGLYLFGSHARGEAEEGSDIDVAVVLDDFESTLAEVRRMLDIAAAVSLEHDCVVSLMPLTTAEWAAMREPFVVNVRLEGVPVP